MSTAPEATSTGRSRWPPNPDHGSPGLIGDTLEVSCHHHQSVRTHPGFEPAAWAADGTLEAMEAAGERFCVAVQWHPETASDVGLLAGLVRAAAGEAERLTE